MFMIGSEILRFMMSPFYVRVAKAHACLASQEQTDLGTNYLQSRLSDSLGPVVNILTIFSNANILKKYNIKGIVCPLLISITLGQVTEK